MGMKLKSNGRVVSASEWSKGLMGDAMKAVEAELARKVERAVCPVHGSHPTNVRVAIDSSTSKGSVQASKCCHELDRAIEALLR